MAKRRPSGDGMVRRREDGRWEGRIVVGHKDNGAPLFHYVSARTQKALLDKLHKSIGDYDGADLTEDSRMTLGQWLDIWLDEYAAPTLRESTLRNYRHYIDYHIKPRLGHKPLYKISTSDVQGLYHELQENGRKEYHPQYGHRLSSATIRRLHNVLHQAMDAAVQRHLAASDPTEGVTLPKEDPPPMRVLNGQQLERFMEEIKKDEVWNDFFHTELTTGLRRGEICGLMWSDFDESSGTLTIRRTLHPRKGGGVYTGETKTGRGRRTINLPPSTAHLLRERKKTACSQWIFPNPARPEFPIHPSSGYHRMKALLKNAGLPDLRFYDLRHTFATHALASGVDAKTLSGILGHAKPSFTLDTYTHTTGDMQKRAAEIVGGFMEEFIVRE